MKKIDTSGNNRMPKLPDPCFLFMKRTFAIALLSIFMLFNTLELKAQQAAVTIAKKNVKLETVLNEIERQTNYLFMYNEKVKTDVLVSVNVKKAPVSTVLNDLLKSLNLSYELKGNHIILSPRKKDAGDKVSITISTVQTKVVSGTVKDDQGNPISGASVSENGIRKATTDRNGVYAVRVSPSHELIVSFMGFKPQSIRVGDKNKYDFILEPTANELEETVVTGYQEISRKDMVGSYQTIQLADIYMPNYNSIDKMLQGQVPGMIVTNSSARVGSSPSIQIRGTSTLLGNSSPLWVVDGIIQEDPIEVNVGTALSGNLKEIIGNQVSWLNPMDIETITVLKDASATAIYGSKASNGVIVITTKKVLANDRVRVNYRASATVNTRPNYGMFNVMNSQERIKFSDDVFASGVPYGAVPYLDYNIYEGVKRLFIEGYINQEEYDQKRRLFETVNTDWFDILTRTGVDQNHSLSFTGGSERMTVASSLSFSDQQGQEIGNDGRKYTGRIAAGLQLNPRLRLNISLLGGYNEISSFGTDVNPMNYAISTSRAVPAYDESGNLAYYQKFNNYQYNRNQPSLGYNILNERDHSNSLTESMHVAINADLKWNIRSWLSYNFTAGYNYNNNAMSSYMGENTYYVANMYRGYDVGMAAPGSESFKAAILPFGGEFFTNDARQKSYNIQNKFYMNWDFDKDNRLNVLIGHELRSGTNIATGNTVWGYSKERGEAIMKPTLPNDLVPTASAMFQYTGYGVFDRLYQGRWARTNQTNNFMSLFATAAYSFKNKYVLNSSVRNDISNRFGQDVNKRFDPTYSFGASWRVAEEVFVKNAIPQLTQLNLRATYGIQGNALTNQSPELLLNRQGVKNVFNQYFSTIARIPNPNLSWERTTNWNFGADIVLFKKISATLDYYTRKSNAILALDIPQEFGVLNANVNGGIIYNKGIEGLIAFSPVNQKDLGISVSLNASRNWNTTGPALIKSNYLQYTMGRAGVIIKEGYPTNGFWSYSFAGLDPTNGNATFNLFDTDQEKARLDPTSYMVYSGQTTPSVTGGMNLNFRYKQFSLGSGFAMIVGAKTRLNSPYVNFNSGYKIPNSELNVDRMLLDRWQKPGDELVTDIPSINPGNITTTKLPDGLNSGTLLSFWEKSDVMVANASFLRCRNIDLSWRFDRKWVNKLRLSNLSVTASMNNVFVLASSKFNGLDPELKNSVMPKSFSFGINCGI